ncbi:MAG TPA: LysR substrate-binding domain-containing protein [Acidimicrobiales bacterium]|nr:LysR substrate-binding domain-containing protein [Acidimicrobiales bacterium]
MELRHLQALLGIAECGSFSAAAVAMGTVQSNVSSHVAKLERELGVALVDRSSGKLTEEGELVAARARRMLVELDAMMADVVALRQEVAGTVRVGTIGTTGRWLVPQLASYLRDRHPHIRLNVSDGTSASLEPQLLSGVLDLAVVTLPVPNDELSATPLFEEDLMLVVPAGHPLAGEAEHSVVAPAAPVEGPLAELSPRRGVGSRRVVAPLPLSTLSELELILPTPGTPLRDEIDAAFQAPALPQHALMEIDGIRLIASLVFDGHGPAILPATAVPAYLRDRVRLLPVDGLPRRRVGVALRRRAMPSAPARVVIELLQEITFDPDGLPEGLHPSP